MHIGIANAWALLLLLVVPLAWWFARGRRSSPGRRRGTLVTALRSLALGCVALALAAPFVSLRSHAVGVVYAFDLSASVQPEFLRLAMEWVRQSDAHYRPALARYVAFADRAELLRDLADVESIAGALAVPRDKQLDRSATDLERAVAAAQLGFRPGYARRLVLISDGKQTHGDVWRELPRLQAEGVRVFVLPAPTGFAAQAWIDDVAAPEGVRQHEPVTLRVRLFSRAATQGRLQVVTSGNAVFDRNVSLVTGRNDVPVELRFKHTGASDVQVKLTTPRDAGDTWLGSVWVGPRLRLLYVESDSVGAAYLADALTSQGIDVQRVTVDQFAADPARALRNADAVLLNDVPATRLNAQATRELEQFVRDLGGGLVFVAGENTYGKGAFADSAVERMLPVKFEARRKRKELDLVLLIDRSYSMVGRKLELAKSAALATLDLMEPEHRLAVVAFDSQPHDVVRLAEVGSKRRAEDAISGMSAGGRTDVYNVLWRAREVLKDSQASTKHIILLSDGQTVPPPNKAAFAGQASGTSDMLKMLHGMGYGKGDIDRLIGEDKPSRPLSASGGFEELVADMAAAGITLSTVAIGDKPNLPLMTGLAQWGSGKSYVAQRDSEIPALFVTEARRLLGDSLIEEPFRPQVRQHSAALTGVDFAAGPLLKGFVAGKPKRFSDVLLEAKASAPVLAETRYGLGKTVAFLSDAKNRWASDWLVWPGYAKFWAQVVRDAARGPGSQELSWHVERQGDQAILMLTALNADGSYRDELWPKVRVVRPDGTFTVLELRQSAPGTYAARTALNAGSAAPYRFELLASAGLAAPEIARVGARTLHYPRGDEFQPRPANTELLQALSARTGGKFAPRTEEIFAPAQDGGMLPMPLWPALAAAAVLVFLLEIVARRARWQILDGALARR